MMIYASHYSDCLEIRIMSSKTEKDLRLVLLCSSKKQEQRIFIYITSEDTSFI